MNVVMDEAVIHSEPSSTMFSVTASPFQGLTTRLMRRLPKHSSGCEAALTQNRAQLHKK